MDLDDKLIIKVQLNDEIRKMPIHNEEITYDELIIMMERVFKHKLNPNDEITIKYKDEDDDLITISDDSDLIFAIETSKVLKLVLTVQNEEIDAEKNEKPLGSLDLKTIRKELQQIRDYTNRLLDKIVHLNNDPTANTNGSGRNSTTGVGDYHVVGGKEFDPLSVGNQTNFQVERTGSAASIGSNIRQDDMKFKNHGGKSSSSQERLLESKEILRPSPTLSKSQNNPTSMTSAVPVSNIVQSVHPSHVQSPASTGAFNMPQSSVGGGHNYPPQNAGNTNMPPQVMNMPQSSSPVGITNLPGQHMPPSNMANQNLPPSNMTHQNQPQSNMTHQNLPPSNMTNQNLPPSNMVHQNLPPSTMSGQHLPPSNMSNFNPVSQSEGGPKMPGYMGQPMQSPVNVQRPAFYPPGTMPGQHIRPTMANYGAPNQAGNMMASGPQVRGNMPPLGPSFFNPQTTMPQGGQMFNPQMQQQPPQNSNYGYQQNK